jgi:hypothetical protein
MLRMESPRGSASIYACAWTSQIRSAAVWYARHRAASLYLVIPAKAGIQLAAGRAERNWIPAFAGMTGTGDERCDV